ncbi:hypothetical protein R5W24_000718 [Gemmata sp. JC717]|uniref:hypothetical protein n=1 Tax=Gemmata algarum TaxID=2975278 RepID=UPI0021BB5448|nr:hypothetical protein [Gemmata algarum]MDY3551640.1 hypothetical protein [Gemmata algarum]
MAVYFVYPAATARRTRSTCGGSSTAPYSNGRGRSFEQFIFFDDRWAAAHPTLAKGIFTFASRWDVLT